MTKQVASLTGQQFGRLTVSEEIERQGSHRIVICKCQCGNARTVRFASLRSGNTRSCGCFQRERVSKVMTTHGKMNTAEYRSWCHLRSRCLNKANVGYHNYGGRGITVCERWGKFENFLIDMGERPSKKHTVERVDNDGPYSPENCIWATKDTQVNNMRTNRCLTLNEVCLTVA